MSDTTPFDPASANVDQVNKYLATASPEEVARVLEAEKNGKNRSSIEAPKPPAPPEEPKAEVCPICFPDGIPEGYTAVGCGHTVA